jgi:hypothetical protein
MTDRHRVLAPRIFALACLVLLGGCIQSLKPLFTDAQPLIGQHPRIAFYVLRAGAARDPAIETFTWRDGRYVPVRGSASDIHDFTLHQFEGSDLIVQSLRLPAEYGIARNLADGTYLLFAVDENDGDAATRDKYCGKDAKADCRIATREAVLALARASAAKPHSSGGLAVLMADR